MLDPPPTDTGLRGAALAVADTNTTGRFTGQSFVCTPRGARCRDAAAPFHQALAGGDACSSPIVPADLLLQLADTPGAATP